MTDSRNILFTNYTLGANTLQNRIIMAPMTRSRATHGTDAPNPLNAEYYAQRAEAGLIISEASQISPTAKGYAWTPGIYSPEQIAGWKAVTDAVHKNGGKIFLQLWHVGRISHPSLQPNGALPVAPSAVVAEHLRAFNEEGHFVDLVTPHALELNEITQIIDDYRVAARNAMTAGFDGVEIHAANGYLLHQFLADNTNLRTDSYGGSIENRIRFVVEVSKAVADEIGADRTGIRISPCNPFNGIIEKSPKEVYTSLLHELNKIKLIYVHVIEMSIFPPQKQPDFDFRALRREFNGAWIVNSGYTADSAAEALNSDDADLVAFGKLFISNPDLVSRFKTNAALNPLNEKTLYGGGAAGYTDYPTL